MATLGPVTQPSPGHVIGVHRGAQHGIGKQPLGSINLLAGEGVEGDAHSGATAQHVYDAKRDPERPNLRQVHLIHAELHEELRAAGFKVAPGQMGENITTKGTDLLKLPLGTILRLGTGGAVVQLTGLRNPCHQLNGVQPGLMKAVMRRDAAGRSAPKAGVMGIVVTSGKVAAGDPMVVELPLQPHAPLPIL